MFQGGFLGLDNIGVFDRSALLDGGGHIDQSDGTSWMGMYSLNMLRIALELATENPVYEDIATKFFEHFLYISGAINDTGGTGDGLWDEEDGFYYDALHLSTGHDIPQKVRSLVGLAPLFAVETLEQSFGPPKDALIGNAIALEPTVTMFAGGRLRLFAASLRRFATTSYNYGQKTQCAGNLR